MTNQEISKILHEMAELYEMDGVLFKPRAYEKAAAEIEAMDKSVEEIFKKDGERAILEIPGVGKSIAAHIKSICEGKKFAEYERLKKKIPVNISELTAVEGVGPKMIKTLYQKLKIKNLHDLERAARAGKLQKLPRMGKKLEEKILKGIEFKKSGGGRFGIGEVLPIARKVKEQLLKISGVENVEIAGSLRRWKETIGDLDFLAVSEEPEAVANAFSKMPEVIHMYAKGNTKVLVRLNTSDGRGIDADLRVVPKKSFGAALQYFTGSKDHNVEVRKIAIKKGYKLNEYGLYRKNKIIAAETEKEIYEKLGMEMPPPEIRIGGGEIGAAMAHKIPNLIGYDDLKGDLQTQTSWTDGKNTIEEMVREAERLGHEYIAITDHTKSLAMTGGSDEKKLERQMKEIDDLQKKFKNIKILKGAEVNIMKDGSLDINDKTLAKLDVVGAAVHSLFNLSKEEQTKRILRAMENPHMDILFHPTGRIINRRKPYEVDIEVIIKQAKKTGTILEIDAHPWRLDLKDEHIKMAREAGVKMVIDTDAHATHELHYLEYGIAQARRAWCTKEDIVNTYPLREFIKMLK